MARNLRPRSAVPTRSPRRVAARLAVVAVLVGATGCGVQAGTDVAAERTGPAAVAGAPTSPDAFAGPGGAMFLRDAGAATAAVTSQKMAMTMTMTGLPMLGDVVMTYEGAFDNVTGQATMTVDLGDLLAGMGGSGSSTMELVVDGDTVYVRSGLFDLFSDGKPWVKTSSDDLSSGDGMGVQSDPTDFLAYLEGAGAEVETVGREVLRGVETTHVRTTLDLATMLDEASPEERAELEMGLDAMGPDADALRAIPLEVWVDDDGYVRRLILEIEVSDPGDGSEGVGPLAMRIDLELYDFNEPVEVSIPDPSEVSDLDDLGLMPGN